MPIDFYYRHAYTVSERIHKEAAMDRAPTALTSIKLCRDCAHLTSEKRCAVAPKVDPVSGERGLYLADTERASPFSCGPTAIHFLPTTAVQAARSVIRQQRHRAIEDALSSLRPDPAEARELLAALMSGLLKRYDARLLEVEMCAKDLDDALEEADGMSDGSPA